MKRRRRDGEAEGEEGRMGGGGGSAAGGRVHGPPTHSGLGNICSGVAGGLWGERELEEGKVCFWEERWGVG